MIGVHDWYQRTLEQARDRMSNYYDRKAKPAPRYKVGDLVILNGKNLKTLRPSKKVNHKCHGPFTITKVITCDLLTGTAVTEVRITLPVKWHCHNTFYVALVEPYRTSKRGLQPEADLAAVLAKANDINAKEISQVQEVVGSSWDKRRKKVMYLVIWEGYPDREDWTEEQSKHSVVESAQEALREFHGANATAARDLRVNIAGALPALPGRGAGRRKNEVRLYLFPGESKSTQVF